MGCQASRNQVCVAENSKPKETKTSSGIIIYPNGEPISSITNMRESSASSKTSKHSIDSGIGQCDSDLNHITEDSTSDVVQRIVDEFESPEDLDLGVVGVACPQRLSAKDKERVEEQRVLATLQKEGLIARSVAKTSTSVCFEVVANGSLPPLKPPPRLETLKKKKKKKKKLTEDEINDKLLQAEERRKELERRRLQKIQMITNSSDVQNCLDKFESLQRDKEIHVKSKEELAAERKEAKLLELQAKLQARKEHAERVRQRKLLQADTDLEHNDMDHYS